MLIAVRATVIVIGVRENIVATTRTGLRPRNTLCHCREYLTPNSLWGSLRPSSPSQVTDSESQGARISSVSKTYGFNTPQKRTFR
jgi:hypothetical protein